MRLATRFSLLSICALLAAAPLYACSTPVFRYALENWPAAPYELVIFQKGTLSPELTKVLDELRNTTKDFNANLMFTTIDTANVPDEYKVLFEAHKEAKLPWMVLRYPPNVSDKTIWNGPLQDRNSILKLVDSPARKQIVKHIADGDGAVWLFVDGNDKEQNDKAVKLVEAQLKEMSDLFSEAYQASLSGEGPPAPEGANPPAVKNIKQAHVGCSLVRIAKDDKAEELFVRTLLEHRPDSAKDAGQPKLFLVFGRGRMLGPLTGAEIVEQNIQGASGFLTGPCMCEIKAQNPGIDLLMNTDWDQSLDTLLHGPLANVPQTPGTDPAAPVITPPPPVAPAMTPVNTTQTSTVPSPDPAPAPSPSANNGPPVQPLSPGGMSNSRIVLFAFGLVAAGVLVVVISMREKRRLD